MLLLEKVQRVMKGELAQAEWSHKNGMWVTIMTFFEKHQITIKKYELDSTIDGITYVKNRKKRIITLTPLLRVREFITTDKENPHSEVIELTYKSTAVHGFTNADYVGEEAYHAIQYCLMMTGHKFDGPLYSAIVPWEKPIRESSKYKKPWRNSNLRDVLAEAKLPVTKSLIKSLARHIAAPADGGHKHCKRELPDLGAIKFVWYICQDINVTVECWPWVEKLYDQWHFSDDLDGWRAWRCLMKSKAWTKEQRIAFCRDISRLGRRGLSDWSDTIDMLAKCYKQFGKDMELPRGSSLKAIHDRMAVLVRKAKLKNAKKPIPYEKEIARVNGYSFTAKIPEAELELRFVLPENKNEITDWSEWLSNCMHSYADNVFNRETTLIGVMHGDKLVIGMEYNKNDRRLRQMSAKGNKTVKTELQKIIKAQLRELDLVGISKEEKDTSPYCDTEVVHAMDEAVEEVIKSQPQQMCLPGMMNIEEIVLNNRNRYRATAQEIAIDTPF